MKDIFTRCQYCRVRVKVENLKYHLQKMHSDSKMPDQIKPLYPRKYKPSGKKVTCSYCGKSFLKRELIMHIEDTHLKYEHKHSNLQKPQLGLGTNKLSSAFQDSIRRNYQIDEFGFLIPMKEEK